MFWGSGGRKAGCDNSSDFHFIIFIDYSMENKLQVAKLMRKNDPDGSCRS